MSSANRDPLMISRLSKCGETPPCTNCIITESECVRDAPAVGRHRRAVTADYLGGARTCCVRCYYEHMKVSRHAYHTPFSCQRHLLLQCAESNAACETCVNAGVQCIRPSHSSPTGPATALPPTVTSQPPAARGQPLGAPTNYTPVQSPNDQGDDRDHALFGSANPTFSQPVRATFGTGTPVYPNTPTMWSLPNPLAVSQPQSYDPGFTPFDLPVDPSYLNRINQGSYPLNTRYGSWESGSFISTGRYSDDVANRDLVRNKWQQSIFQTTSPFAGSSTSQSVRVRSPSPLRISAISYDVFHVLPCRRLPLSSRPNRLPILTTFKDIRVLAMQQRDPLS